MKERKNSERGARRLQTNFFFFFSFERETVISRFLTMSDAFTSGLAFGRIYRPFGISNRASFYEVESPLIRRLHPAGY